MAAENKLEILIVDDRPENLTSLKQLLVQDDLEILTAQSGNEALGLMLEHDLALVLLDVQMPEMDGFEVAELMHRNERTRRIPIIFVTAINKERRHVFSGFEAGAVDYMFKPVDPFIMRSKVKVFLDIKRHELAREKLVSELDEANSQLRELSERKSDYLSSASHELRTPLTVIKEYCSLVNDEIVGSINEEQKKCMGAALRNCNRLADLVNDLLDLDSIESGHSTFQRKAVNLERVIEEAFNDFQPNCDTAGLSLNLEQGGPLPQVVGEERMITQVMVNLLGNALKFTPSGGSITLRTEVTPAGVRVEVEDTGPGISPMDQPKVFQKFTQLDRQDGPGAKGTGLGLAISHKIMEMLGGGLGLDSEPGRGSTFYFDLPEFSHAAQMQALVADVSSWGHGPREDCSLILIRPDDGGKHLPSWLDEVVGQTLRDGIDRHCITEMKGEAVKAVLLKAPRQGAMAFLTRLDQKLKTEATENLGRLKFSLLELDQERQDGFQWEPENYVFSDLALFQDSKGLSHV